MMLFMITLVISCCFVIGGSITQNRLIQTYQNDIDTISTNITSHARHILGVHPVKNFNGKMAEYLGVALITTHTGTPICTGAYIKGPSDATGKYVLTAAHCLYVKKVHWKFIPHSNLRVEFGVTNNGQGTPCRVLDYRVNNKYPALKEDLTPKIRNKNVMTDYAIMKLDPACNTKHDPYTIGLYQRDPCVSKIRAGYGGTRTLTADKMQSVTIIENGEKCSKTKPTPKMTTDTTRKTARKTAINGAKQQPTPKATLPDCPSMPTPPTPRKKPISAPPPPPKKTLTSGATKGDSGGPMFNENTGEIEAISSKKSISKQWNVKINEKIRQNIYNYMLEKDGISPLIKDCYNNEVTPSEKCWSDCGSSEPSEKCHIGRKFADSSRTKIPCYSNPNKKTCGSTKCANDETIASTEICCKTQQGTRKKAPICIRKTYKYLCGPKKADAHFRLENFMQFIINYEDNGNEDFYYDDEDYYYDEEYYDDDNAGISVW